MTAQNSAAKPGVFYKFLPYYLNKVRYLRPQLIMCSILSLLSYPLISALTAAACGISGEYYAKYNDLIQNSQLSTAEVLEQLRPLENAAQTVVSLMVTAAVIAAMCLVALFVFTFVTTLRSFRYLYNKTTVDMDYSLPVDHNTRFFGDLAAVFTVSILPHLAAALISAVIFGFCRVPEESAVLSLVIEVIGQAAFTGIFACIMEIAICLLTISVCGRTAEAYIYPVLVNFAIPVIHSLGILIVESGIYGATSDTLSIGFSSAMYAITCTSPFGMIFTTVFSWFSTYSYDGTELVGSAPIMDAKYLITVVVLTVLFLAGSYFLIKHRRAERVGMSWVYRGLDVILPGIVIFSIVMPVCYSAASRIRGQNSLMGSYSFSSNFLPGLIIGTAVATFIVYIIMALISGKNFRRFGRTVLNWAATLAASVAVCVLLNISNGFGTGNNIPAQADIKSVQVSYLDSRQGGYFSTDDNYFNIRARSGDDELLALARDIHAEALGDMSADKNYSCRVAFYYTLKDGGILAREYNVTGDTLDRIKGQMLAPEGWSSNVLGDLQETLNDGYVPDTISVDAASVSLSDGASAADQLKAAVIADSSRITPEFVRTQPSWKENTIRIYLEKKKDSDSSVRSSIAVYDWMENTIALLDGWGLDISSGFTAADYGAAFIVKADGDGIDAEYMLRLADNISDEEYYNATGDYDSSDREYTNTFGTADVGDPTLEELVAASGDLGSYQNGDYIILLTRAETWQAYMNGTTGCMMLQVPDDMADLADSLMREHLISEYAAE